MTIQLDIPDKLYERIKSHAIPFVDLTPVSVLERWADHFEKDQSMPETHPTESNILQSEEYDPLLPPDLTHTRCSGFFGSRAFRNWNDLMKVAHLEALDEFGSYDELSFITYSNIQIGEVTEKGYRYVPEGNFSLQGVDAKHAWLHALRLAQVLKRPIKSSFVWRNNKKAAFPGKSGTLAWQPN